jgi:hypothetical protein
MDSAETCVEYKLVRVKDCVDQYPSLAAESRYSESSEEFKKMPSAQSTLANGRRSFKGKFLKTLYMSLRLMLEVNTIDGYCGCLHSRVHWASK